MNRVVGMRQLVMLLVGMFPILVFTPTAADISLPAVTDNGVASNSIDSTLFLEIPGQVLEYQAAVDISGEAWLRFDEATRTLSAENFDLTFGSIDFSIPVSPWELTGTLELEILDPYYSVDFDPAYVDPVNGFFTTFMSIWGITYTLSAYIDGVPIVEDYEGYEWLDSFGISGTFIEIGDTSGDGLSEYELAFHGPVSFSADLGEIPPIGQTTMTIGGELDLGYIAEPLPPDTYEPDNFPNDGTLLSPDEVQSHSIHQDGDVDWMTVSVLENHEYEVEGFNVSGSNPEMILEVYDDTGSVVAGWSGWHGALVSWTAMYTGTYYVKATTWGWNFDSGHFDDQGGGWAYCDYDITLRITATAFILLYPEDGAELSLPPIFGWTREGYDLFLLTTECYYEDVIYRNDSPPLLDTAFEMPSSWWDSIPTDYPCYWYVVGMDTVTGEVDIAGPKVFWRIPPCADNDEDGYGDPVNASCSYPELDCDDDALDDPPICDSCICGEAECAPCARCIHPGATEFDNDGIDSDCSGGTFPWGTPTSVMGTSKPTSDPLNYLVILMAPIGTLLILKRLRRRR